MIHANMQTLVSILRSWKNETEKKKKTIDNATREFFKKAEISDQAILK